MSNDKAMCYVAADPQQPGAAWAAMVDDTSTAERKKDAAKNLASWIRDGAIVERVTVEKAREMLSKWERPTKENKRAAKAAAELF